MPRLEFDEGPHLYYLDGELIPSVTTILSHEGLYPDFEFVDRWYAERGSLVHLATHYLDNGTLDRESLDSEILPFIESYEKFKEVYRFQVEESEIRLYNETYWFCGTADKVGKILWNGQVREALIDLKCGQPEWGYQFQLAGYSFAKGLHYSTLRLGVYLKKDGSLPQVIEYTDTNDFSIFHAATILYHAKQGRKAA